MSQPSGRAIPRPKLILLGLAASSLVAACGGGNSANPGATTTTTTTTGETTSPTGTGPERGAPDLGQVDARLVRVARPERPTAMAVHPGDGAIYVAEKTGRVRAVAGAGGGTATLALDLSEQVSGGGEQGLLGLAFSPDGGLLYVNYTDVGGDTRVVEYAFAGGRADPATRRELLTVEQPFANHNGGEVMFGPDGKLYIGLGDGGGQRDPEDRGQDLGTLLGKILRIDPRPSAGLPYTVPTDNPFVGRSGARPEIWAFGLRNPWRFTWDRATGDLWIADVGQNDWEEIDFAAAGSGAGPGAGANFGWSEMDSMHRLKGDNPPGAILPIFEYTHDGGNCSIVGGYVYRGNAIPALGGAYVYGDTCSGRVWALVQQDGEVTDQRELDLGVDGLQISSFGEDGAGELYVLDLNGGLYRLAPA